MVGRTGGRAERLHFFHQEFLQGARIQEGLGLLVEIGLVGRAAALGQEEELVLIARGGVDVDLRRQVGLGVDLLVHVQRRVLGVAQVLLGIGGVDAGRKHLGVVTAGPHVLALLGDHAGRAGVLADRQHVVRGHLGVAQHGKGHFLVVARGFGVGKDLGHLLVVGRAQAEGDLAHGLVGQHLQPLRIDLEHFLAVEGLGGHILGGAFQQPEFGRILAEREGILIHKTCHSDSPCLNERQPVGTTAHGRPLVKETPDRHAGTDRPTVQGGAPAMFSHSFYPFGRTKARAEDWGNAVFSGRSGGD